MKNFKQNMLSWITIALSFFFTLGILYIAYGALTNLPTKVWTGSWLTFDNWNKVVDSLTELDGKINNISSIPTWFIGSFYRTTCPSWWIIADWSNSTPDLRGKFIRANVTSTTYDPDYATRSWWLGDGNKVGSTQVDTFQDHTHTNFGTLSGWYPTGVIWPSSGYSNGNYSTSNANSGNKSTETRPRNVALLYCMKQ